jgi:hypothetical protein
MGHIGFTIKNIYRKEPTSENAANPKPVEKQQNVLTTVVKFFNSLLLFFISSHLYKDMKKEWKKNYKLLSGAADCGTVGAIAIDREDLML